MDRVYCFECIPSIIRFENECLVNRRRFINRHLIPMFHGTPCI